MENYYLKLDNEYKDVHHTILSTFLHIQTFSSYKVLIKQLSNNHGAITKSSIMTTAPISYKQSTF